MTALRCAALGVFCLAASVTSAFAAVLYDFESGAQGWACDGTVSYNNNFSLPAGSTLRVHEGAQSLRFPLNYADKTLGGIVNDAVQYEVSPLNLSAVTGVVVYVYLEPAVGVGNPAYPLQAHVFVQTGSEWKWFQGATVNLRPGQWIKLPLVFDLATDSNGVTTSVANRDLVNRLGVHVFGSAYDAGATALFIDSVQTGSGDDLTAPNVPVNLAASALVSGGNNVTLTWSQVASGDVDHYNIYQYRFSGTAVSTTTYLSFIAHPNSVYGSEAVVNGETYFYRVTAVDKSGNESSASAEVSASPTGPSALQAPVGSPPLLKGMTYSSWQTDQYASVSSSSSLDDLQSTGANAVALVVTYYQTGLNDNFIVASPTKTATLASLTQAIQDLHARGFKVMLKPHVNLFDDALWRGNISPASTSTWFTSYRSFITPLAQLAQAQGVEFFCIGTELKTLTNGNAAEWQQVINELNAAYSGPLVYSANAVLFNDEFAHITFWNQLDFLGLNLYFPLTGNPAASLSDLKHAWSNSLSGSNFLQLLTEWRAHTGKDILVTEIGYQSADGTNTSPFGLNAGYDGGEQADATSAALEALNNRPWLRGLFWWYWDPNPNVGGPGQIDYTIQNKPALNVLTSRYGGETVRNFYNFETSTQAWLADNTTNFADNLGAPSTTPQEGSPALTYPFNLNEKSGGLLKDFAYVEPGIPKDLSGYTGLKAWVGLPAGANVNSNTPVTVALVVQTGDNFEWYQGGTFRNLFPGQMREISLNFSSAESFPGGASTPHVAVQNTDDIRRIGINVSGGAASSGSTQLFVDNVSARGTGPILGLSLGTTAYNFGAVNPMGSAASAAPLLLENSGNMVTRYSLQCSSSTPGQWGPSLAPAAGVFVLNARFNSTLPAEFVESNHAVIAAAVFADGTRFAGDETGINVNPSDVRRLWLEFRAPFISTVADSQPQSITLTVQTEIQ